MMEVSYLNRSFLAGNYSSWFNIVDSRVEITSLIIIISAVRFASFKLYIHTYSCPSDISESVAFEWLQYKRMNVYQVHQQEIQIWTARWSIDPTAWMSFSYFSLTLAKQEQSTAQKLSLNTAPHTYYTYTHSSTRLSLGSWLLGCTALEFLIQNGLFAEFGRFLQFAKLQCFPFSKATGKVSSRALKVYLLRHHTTLSDFTCRITCWSTTNWWHSLEFVAACL